ncbi:type II toxin-antitoxin system RelE/ParE family toxin [Terriglobus saanensis]|uniref:type II toxin-antitoxin system RelE/ParE family toxin n=1 Tax=Terriglobus saanensis TaxID=870903 RepID=UPI00315DCAFB
MAAEVQDELLAEAKFVELFGPETGRPHVDTLEGSKYANMKELRFEAADGEWRAPPLRSTRSVGRLCWSPLTRAASTRSSFTSG